MTTTDFDLRELIIRRLAELATRKGDEDHIRLAVETLTELLIEDNNACREACASPKSAQ